METMVTLEVLKLVRVLDIVLLFPIPTLPKSRLGLPRTTVSLMGVCCFPINWQPVREMRAAAIRKETMLARQTDLTFKGSDLVKPYVIHTAGDFRSREGLKLCSRPPHCHCREREVVGCGRTTDNAESYIAPWFVTYL